jgi:hypothetical protein
VRAVKLNDVKSVTARARSCCWGSGAGTYSSGRIARSGVETAEGEERREESWREVAAEVSASAEAWEGGGGEKEREGG